MALFALLDDDRLDQRVHRVVLTASAKGAPDANLYRVLGRRPDLAVTFAEHWETAFQGGSVEHRMKELVRLKVVAITTCGYCGQLRSRRATADGLTENDVQAVVDHSRSDRFTAREKSAMDLAACLATDPARADEGFYQALRESFSDDEIIELSWLIGLCIGLSRVVSTWKLAPVRCAIPQMR